ncbi:MAG TPA: sortase [Ilumatobacteraceae bacterium]|nr:sortase [Ilumatobacteraceae bacterium]
MRIPGLRDHAIHVAARAGFGAALVAGAFFVSSAGGSAAPADPVVDAGPARVTASTTTTPSKLSVAAVDPATSATSVPPMASVADEVAIAPVVEPLAVPVATEQPTDTAPPVETTAVTLAVVAIADPPTAIPETVTVTDPAPTNESTCRSDLPGAVMTIAMPDISYWCPVYAGGQSVIDAGVATMITSRESTFPLAAGPGAPGTLWITGHRVSHGGPFAAVPDLADGAVITVSDPNGSASYVIVGRSYVEVRNGLAVDASGRTTEAATLDAVLRPDRNAGFAPRLLLQTCDADSFRWMIYADLIEG